MTRHTRLIATIALAIGSSAPFILAQGTPPQTPQTQAPAGQAPPPAAGRGDAGQRGAGQGGRQGGGGRRGGFTQFTRELAPQDVLVRGKSLYEANCASCHATDLRGGPKGTNLLRSGVALQDKHGEMVGAAIAKHTPALTLVEADSVAIAEYIHSVHATMSGQGSPPGRNPTGVELNVLVGDAKAGEAAFASLCASCHSVTGDLKGLASKFEDATHKSRIEVLLEGILPALERVDPNLPPDALLSSAVEANVRNTVEALLATPEGRARLEEGTMRLVGAVYEIESGRVRFLE